MAEKAAAILFARKGPRVFLVDRDGASAREDAGHDGASEGGRATVFAADRRRLRRRLLLVHGRGLPGRAYGTIDTCFTTTSESRRATARLSVSKKEAWDQILRVNLKSGFLTCKHVLPSMRQRQSGSIVNVSSLAAVAAATDLTAYKVSKAGVNALTHSLAMANARYGIRANAVMPGLIETPMAIEGMSQKLGVSKADLIRDRNAHECPSAERWGPPGTSRMRPCFWPPTKPGSSPASCCRSMAARAHA